MTTETENKILSRIQELEHNLIRSNPTKWLSMKEAAAYTGFSYTYFKEKIKFELTPVTIGKRLMFDRTQLDEFMEAHKVIILKSDINQDK